MKKSDESRIELIRRVFSTHGDFIRDLFVVFFASMILYTAMALNGPGWGAEASLQTACIVVDSERLGAAARGLETLDAETLGAEARAHDIPAPPRLFLTPARIFVRFAPIFDPATAVSYFSSLLAALTLLVVYASIRFCNIPARTTLLAVASLAMSQAYFAHATRPNLSALSTLFLAVELHLIIRFIHLKSRPLIPAIMLCAALASFTLPASMPVAVLPLAWIVLRNISSSSRALTIWIALLIFRTSISSGFGFHVLWILPVFIAFQFPIAGWLIIPWGTLRLRRRAMPILEILLTIIIASFPDKIFDGREYSFREHLDMALPASVAAAHLMAFGLDYLYELRAKRKERILFMTPILAFSLTILPIVSTSAFAYLAHNSGLEDRIVTATGSRVRLLATPWHNALWYALWPMKRGESSRILIADAEKNLPSRAILLADPEIAPVINYAQNVEGRLMEITPVILPSGDKTEAVERLIQRARTDSIFLAGVDPEFYPVEEIGNRGELIPAGIFLRFEAVFENN